MPIINKNIKDYNLLDLLDYCGFGSLQQQRALIKLLQYAEINFECILDPKMYVLNIINGLKQIVNELQQKHNYKKLDPEVINPLLLDMRMPYKLNFPDTSGIPALVYHIDQRTTCLWADIMGSDCKNLRLCP